MKVRTFDLLTPPVAAGRDESAIAHLSWAAPRGFIFEVAPEVAELFAVATTPTFDPDTGKFELRVRRKEVGPPARFAALVYCETDEESDQEPTSFEWPPLVEATGKDGVA